MFDDEEPTRAIADASPAAATQIGRYELLLELASGGMATVYIGRQRGAGGFQRLVAIKRMHPHVSAVPELAASFMDEARIASLIRHPNVVNVHDVHDADGEPLLVMDFVDGASLANVMRAARKRETRVPRPAALRIVVDALYGLHAAHEQTNLEGNPLGVVHRDATPHNILIGNDGTARLTDFGIAKAAERSVHTATGLAKGKFRYMAPEQARGGALDRRVDIFAMGIVCWELLTGERMFAGESDAEVLLSISAGDYSRPGKVEASVPAPLDEIVMRALAVDPDGRWPTAKAFAEALTDWAQSTGELASPSDVARLVDEFCGQEIGERRAMLADIVAGRRPPLISGGRPMGRVGTGSTAAAPLTVDSVKIVPAVTSEQLRKRRVRRRVALAGALAGAVVVLGAAFALLRRAQPGTAAATSVAPPAVASAPGATGAAPAASAALVRIQLGSDSDIAEVRAAGIKDFAFTPDGASFELPVSADKVDVHIRFTDGSEVVESVVPRENTAIRVRTTAAAHGGGKPHTTGTASRPPAGGATTHATGSDHPPPGLEQNPYE